MAEEVIAPTPAELEAEVSRTRTALALAFAMTFPTLMAWLYFLVLSRQGGASTSQQAAYAAGKCVQFAFPLVFLRLSTGHWPRRRPARPEGLVLSLGFGLLVAAALFGLYFTYLRHSPLLAQTPARILNKLREFRIDTPAGYFAAAGFLSVAHSLLEEYYWRWFVFEGFRQLLSLAPAVLLASLAFMAHHVIILTVFLPGRFLPAVVPFSLAIAVGGAVWCWLYERTGSLLGPWLSHLVIDAAIFVVAWDLLQRSGW